VFLKMKRGMSKVVAVDIQGARMAPDCGLPIGHIGHLNQIPRHAHGSRGAEGP